jgi:hypothetical protein
MTREASWNLIRAKRIASKLPRDFALLSTLHPSPDGPAFQGTVTCMCEWNQKKHLEPLPKEINWAVRKAYENVKDEV